MWNRIPRLLHVHLLTLLTAGALLISLPTASVAWPLAPAAATCGDVVINEILFKPSNPPDDEWVELYVVNALDTGEVLKVSDLETTGGQFGLEFTLTDVVPADRYIVVHGNNYTDSQESEIGYVNVFNAGDGSDLANTSDNVVLSVNGIECEEVFWGSGSTPASGAPVTLSYGSTSSLAGGESIARSPNGPGGEFVRSTTAGLYNAAEGHSIGRNNVNSELPVTLSWFHATRKGDTVHFAWQTATETGNAGFNLLAETNEGEIVQINPILIPSTVIDSVEATDYSYSIATDANLFYVQEVGIDGVLDEIGPFALGQAYGVHVEPPGADGEIDTESILYLPLVHR